MRTSVPVYFLLEKDAWFECEELAGGNSEGFTGLGIAPVPVVLLVDNELAESGDLDLFPSDKGLLHDVQDGLHDLLGLFSLEVAGESDIFD